MKKKILVIDDDQNVRTYLESLFEDNGYAVETAGSTKEGLEMVRSSIPDLITLDIEMPGEWGPRFYQQLSSEEKFKRIPIVVISGLPGHGAAVKKAAAAISKPFEPEQLMKTIKDILN